MRLSPLVLGVVLLALCATPASATPTVAPVPAVAGRGARPEVAACRGDAQCVESLLRARVTITVEEARALADALDALHHEPDLASQLRSSADREDACDAARRVVASAGVPPAQREMMRQYVATRCR